MTQTARLPAGTRGSTIGAGRGALVLLLLGGMLGVPGELGSEVLFQVAFDRGIDADKARGEAAARRVGSVAETDGVAGKGVVVGQGGWLEYELAENLNTAGGAGSIELWLKPLNWDGAEPREATFFTAEYVNPAGAPELAGLFRLYSLPGVARLTFIAGPYPNDKPEKRVTVQAEIGDWKRAQWHHLVVTWDGFSLALYLDGELKRREAIKLVTGSGENPRFVPPLGRVFTVGGKPWGESGDTAIDEVTVYRSALLPEDAMQRFLLRSGARDLAAPPASSQGAPASAPAAVKPGAFTALALLGGTPTRAVLAAPLADRKPVIDGVVDEAEWAGASATNAFVEILTPEVRFGRHENRLCVCVAGQTLYLGLESGFRAGAPPNAEAGSNSGRVFDDDCFEVHLSSPATADVVAKYDINSAGHLDHYQAKPGGKLIPTQAVCAARVLPGRWSCELAIPLAELGAASPASPGDRFLLQVARSYKEGSVAQRAAASRSAGETRPKEEYVGFPWNSSFLNVGNYAELVLVGGRQFVQSSVDVDLYSRKGELSVRAVFGPAWSATVRRGEFTVYASTGESAAEQVAVEPDGRCSLERALPEQAAVGILSFPGALCLKLPLARRAAGLRLGHTIFSHSNTVQVVLDISDLAVAQPGDVSGEVLLRAPDARVVASERIGSFARTEEKRALSIAGLPAGTYSLDCSLTDRSGTTVARASQTLQVFRELRGEGNRLGITDEAPAPWLPVTVAEDNRVTVWGRTYEFGASILPRQVTILGKPILSGPIAYELQLDGGPGVDINSGELVTVEQKPGRAVLNGVHRSAEVEVRHVLTVEFDGMIRCDAEITARKPIRRLALRMPVLRDRARLFHAAAWRGKFTTQILSPLEIGPDFRWSCAYLYPVMWVADMRGGLSWFAGSDRAWAVDRARDRLVVTPEGMQVIFVDTESADTTSISITYGLQAFPTRPMRPDWREFGRVREAKWLAVFTPDNLNEQQKDGLVPERYLRQLMQGGSQRRERALLLPFGNFPRSVEDYTALGPDVYAFGVEALQQLLRQRREMGIEFIAPYLTPTYCSDAIPESRFYWSNWTAIPKARFDEDGESAVCVANAQWRDFWLQAFHDYVKKYGIKAVFHDMAGTYAEEGTLNGLGYTRNGVRYPEYPVWETREVFRRAYILHRELFPDAMSFMNYGDFTPPVHSFADFLLAAERYEKEGRADRSIYELDGDGNLSSFTYQTSLPFGPKAMHNGWLKYRYAMDEKEPTVHMYGLVLLHDLVQWNINENPEVRTAVHALKKRFGIGYDRDVIFLPYWENQDKYRTGSADTVLSFYRLGSKLLAVVVNKSMTRTFEGTVELSTRELGIDSVQTVEVFDPLTNTYTGVTGGGTPGRLRLALAVKPTLCKVVLVN